MNNHFKSLCYLLILVILHIGGGFAYELQEVENLRRQVPSNPQTTFLCSIQQMAHYIGNSINYAVTPLYIFYSHRSPDDHYYFVIKSLERQPKAHFWNFDIESFVDLYDTKIRLNLRDNNSPEILNRIIITFFEKSWAQQFYKLAITDDAKGEELAYGATKFETYLRYANKLLSTATPVKIYKKSTSGDRITYTENQTQTSYTEKVSSYSLLSIAAPEENLVPELIFSTQKFTISTEVKNGNKIVIALKDFPKYIFVLYFDTENGQPDQFFTHLQEDSDEASPAIPDDEVTAILTGNPYQNQFYW